MQHVFRRRFGNALQWYQVLVQRMKHEVETWVQAIFSSRRDRTKPRDEISMPTHTIPPANSPPTPNAASTHDPSSLMQPSTAATGVVRDEETHPKIITIGKAEGTAKVSWQQIRIPTAFPLPSNDSTRTFDCQAREGQPSPYLTRRCPVCFSASAARFDHSRYVIIIIQVGAGLSVRGQHTCYCLFGCQLFPTSSSLKVQGPKPFASRHVLDFSGGCYKNGG